MAVDALVRGVFVDHDLFVCNCSGLGMALGTRDIGMATGQGKVSPGVMVKGGGCPPLSVVTIGAVSLIVLGQELFIVGVRMAGFALIGCALEARFGVCGGFVAIGTGDGAMSAE